MADALIAAADMPEPEDGAGEIAMDQAASTPPADPFNPATLRLSSDYAASLGGKKTVLTVPVRKPAKEWFIRVHPSPDYQLDTPVIELKEDGGVYLVARKLWPELEAERTFGPRTFRLAVNKQGSCFLWMLRLPGVDGKLDEWSRTAREAAEISTKAWIRVQANMDIGAYDVYEASGDLGEPAFPDRPLGDLLQAGFKGRYIDSIDHPVLRKLRGEI